MLWVELFVCYTLFLNLQGEFSKLQAQNMSDVRSKLISKVGEDPSEGLLLVDAVQRVGIDYHFDKEIDAFLQSHYQKFINTREQNDYQDLFSVSLSFRLLRQHGYYVPAG